MKLARLAGLVVIAILATSLVMASVAMAEPEFKPTTGKLTGDSGASILEADNGVDKVSCGSDVFSGLVGSATTVDNVVVHFLNCESTGTKGSGCTVKSNNTSTEGLILTNTLDGVLGLILPKPSSGTGVGLLLLPSSGTKFVTLSGNGCTEETTVTGTVAGEVEPVTTKSVKTGTIKFIGSEGVSCIKLFDLPSGVTDSVKLTAFSTPADEDSTELITFELETEIT